MGGGGADGPDFTSAEAKYKQGDTAFSLNLFFTQHDWIRKK